MIALVAGLGLAAITLLDKWSAVGKFFKDLFSGILESIRPVLEAFGSTGGLLGAAVKFGLSQFPQTQPQVDGGQTTTTTESQQKATVLMKAEPGTSATMEKKHGRY